MSNPHIKRIETKNGHATVSNFYVCTSTGIDGDDSANYSGHVWAEIQCGMSVNRINVTPDEARAIAALLLEAAETFEG
jgi:hypothetical protein